MGPILLVFICVLDTWAGWPWEETSCSDNFDDDDYYDGQDDDADQDDDDDDGDDEDGHLCRLAMRADVKEWGCHFRPHDLILHSEVANEDDDDDHGHDDDDDNDRNHDIILHSEVVNAD